MMSASTPVDLASLCAWCGTWIREPDDGFDEEGGDVSHGMCIPCLGSMFELPVEDVYALTEAEVDKLPFGLIELSADGRIRDYGTEEGRRAGFSASTVRGMHFFLDIAPCTRDSEFQRRWDALMEAGEGTDDFEFVFAFRDGHREVRVRMFVDRSQDKHMILLQDQ